MEQPTINTVLSCPHLPTLPSVAVRVLELTRDQQVKISEIARAVQNDQALCVRILRTINSSYYGLSQPCPTITRAITYLGLNTVKSLVLGFSLVDVTQSHAEGFDLFGHWRRAVYSATAARRVAAASSLCDPEEAFIAALMQDIGMLAMHVALGTRYSEIVGSAGDQHPLLPTIEKELLGFDHALVGGKLGERWKLPRSLIEAILHHHDVQAAQHHHLVRTVALGGQFAEVVESKDTAVGLRHVRACAKDWFNLGGLDTESLMDMVSRDASELADLFQMETGAASDINSLLAEAEDEALAHQVRVIHETERLRQRNAELGRQAAADALTGLANRRRFDAALQQSFEATRQKNGSLGVIVIDIDHFKRFNDTYGHHGGDAVLVEVAMRMRSVVESDCLLARYGGEEFTLLLPDRSRQVAAAIAERLRIAIAGSPIRLAGASGEGELVEITASLGVACMEPGLTSMFTWPAILVAAADKSLYAAKDAGRNCVRVFAPRLPSDPGVPRTAERLSA